MPEQQSFLEKVSTRSNLSNINAAQRAANVVFRILRDMLPKDAEKRVGEELHKDQETRTNEMDAEDLWQDPNVMVAFFSRISPLRPLAIKPGTFWLRFEQEAALPEGVDPKTVASAVFSAAKEELSHERIQEIASFLPGEIRQVWEAA